MENMQNGMREMHIFSTTKKTHSQKFWNHPSLILFIGANIWPLSRITLLAVWWLIGGIFCNLPLWVVFCIFHLSMKLFLSKKKKCLYFTFNKLSFEFVYFRANVRMYLPLIGMRQVDIRWKVNIVGTKAIIF